MTICVHSIWVWPHSDIHFENMLKIVRKLGHKLLLRDEKWQWLQNQQKHILQQKMLWLGRTCHMSQGQMLQGQIYPWYLTFVKDGLKNLTFKFGPNRVRNFLRYCCSWVPGGGWIRVIFMLDPTLVLGWVLTFQEENLKLSF